MLIGDAAHATVPFYGQGMNSAFESVVELVACLERFAPERRAEAFAAYQAARKPHNRRGGRPLDPELRRAALQFPPRGAAGRRRVEVMLNRLMPNTYVPLHVKVSHQLVGLPQGHRRLRPARDRILRWFGFDLLVYAVALAGFAAVGARAGGGPAAPAAGCSPG